MKKEIRRLLAACKSQGWRVEQGRNSHYKCYPPDKKFDIIVLPHSPGGSQCQIDKFVSQFRKAGLKIPKVR